MLLTILTILHHSTTLLFGIFISAFFLGITPKRRNIGELILFALCDGLLFLVSIQFLGWHISNLIYPLLVHIPLIIFLSVFFRFSILSSCVSVFSAYLCCQFSNWIGLLALAITGDDRWYYTTRILVTILTFYFLYCFVCHTTKAIFSKPDKELCIIGFLPFVYYIFDYTSTKFSNLLYSGNKVIVEFMGFAFCISYLMFLLFYFKEYEKKQEIHHYNERMKMQLLATEKEIEQVRKSEEQLKILRHDMRHHLHVILTHLNNHHHEKAISYIQQISNAYDETIVQRYCQNETLNSILSLYHQRFFEQGVTFRHRISTNEFSPCSDLTLCTILSNALENSMHALEKADHENKWVSLNIFKRDSHLLIEIKNPLTQVPKFMDGIPVSAKKGHGIGVKSIVYYVQQMKGQCHFSISDGCFVLKIIL